MSQAKPKDRPILFSGPMVRALQAGRKTVTRRIVKPQPCKIEGDGNDRLLWFEKNLRRHDGELSCVSALCNMPLFCPYGQAGDRLWVRETWTPDHAAFYPNFPIVYRADFGPEYERNERGEVYSPEQKAWYPFKWRPSIFMPRHHSRITLEIVGVRAERLQEITEEDAIAEGAQCAGVPAAMTNRGAFGKLWNKINPESPWESDPWVWRVEFKRMTP